jgi:hypothetical protein
MKMKLVMSSVVLLLALMPGCVVERQGKYWPPPRPGLPPSQRPLPPPPVVVVHRTPKPMPRRPEPWVQVTISADERRILHEYARSCVAEAPRGKGKKKGWKHGGLPPGLAKKVERSGQLPPGWQRKLAKGEIMPVEVYQQCHSLPREVVVQLPPPPSGTVMVAIDGKIVRLIQATREILDVFEVEI